MSCWDTAFDNPIPLPNGGQLITLRDAGNYITGLTKAEQDSEAWRLATKILIATAEGRDFLMHAAIAMHRALRPDNPEPTAPRRKPTKKHRIIR